jgi:hypothetical protein
MVFTDSVSPLLKFRDDLRRQNPEVKGPTPKAQGYVIETFHPLKVVRLR